MSRTGCKYCYSLVCCRCNRKHRAAASSSSAAPPPPTYSGMSLAALPNSNQGNAATGNGNNSTTATGQATAAADAGSNGASLSADQYVAAEQAVSTSHHQLMTNNMSENIHPTPIDFNVWLICYEILLLPIILGFFSFYQFIFTKNESICRARITTKLLSVICENVELPCMLFILYYIHNIIIPTYILIDQYYSTN